MTYYYHYYYYNMKYFLSVFLSTVKPRLTAPPFNTTKPDLPRMFASPKLRGKSRFYCFSTNVKSYCLIVHRDGG